MTTLKTNQEKPVAVRATVINTSVYGVQGQTADGEWHHIRLFDGLKLRADEGIDLYTKRDAVSEAAEIGKRNGIPVAAYYAQ